MKSRARMFLAALFLVSIAGLPAADFTVINTNNSGAGSLRQAILDANGNPGPDRITFNIPGGGLQIIRPSTAFPIITDSLEVDGYTQPGSSPNTLANADNAVRRIELDGVIAGSDGLTIRTNNSVIRGLSIRQFANAIAIQGSSNLVVGNRLGSDEAPSLITNSAAGNTRGIAIGGPCCNAIEVCCNTIGGSQRADRNVIAGNRGNAVLIGDSGFGWREVVDTRIIGNFLGVDSSGVRPSVNQGSSTISVHAVNGVVLGGVEEGARNILASDESTIRFYQPPHHAEILGNYMGVGADGLTPFPSTYAGVFVFTGGDDSQPVIPINCRIEQNRIANCTVGIDVWEEFPPIDFPPWIDLLNPHASSRITISKNSIYNNTNGFDGNPIARSGASYFGHPQFGPFARTNDLWDLDTGANNRQNFPQISSVVFETNTTVLGVLNSAPSTTFRIEFFANTVPHPSGFGEGETYLGFTNVTTDFNGSGPFAISLPGVLAFQPYITATATDPEGSTSMFSRSVHGRSPGPVLFHLQPKAVTVLPYTNVTFVGDASGAEPLTLQWQRNGTDIPGATNATLTLSNVVWDMRGTYTLVAGNALGAVESLPAELTVIPQPTILVQPTNVIVFPGVTVTFSVQAGGMLPITYQWRRDGVDISGANGSSLTLSNVDWPVRGDYTAVLSNAFGVTESTAAGLLVKIRPGIAQQPISQDVVVGGAATLSVAISNSATVPLTYVWRSNALIVATEVSMRHVSFLKVTNIQNTAGYFVLASNYFGPPGVVSSRATLTVLADTDHDGLPDSYEDAYQLDRDNPDDAQLDADGDGLSNAAEYTAGTDPRDPLNRLRVNRIEATGGVVFLEFSAVSNKTYSIQYTDLLAASSWATLSSLPGRTTNGTARVADPHSSTHRIYRLVTPRQ